GGGAAGTHRGVPAAGEGAGRTASSPGDLRGLERSQRRGARHAPGPDGNRRHVMVAEPPHLWNSRVVRCLEERLLAPNLLTQTLPSACLRPRSKRDNIWCDNRTARGEMLVLKGVRSSRRPLHLG